MNLYSKKKVLPIEGLLYHYTSQEGLLNIIAQKKIWATNIHYLNDATEFAYAINLTKEELVNRQKVLPKEHSEFFERIKKILDLNDKVSIYVSSFSEIGDLLSQWRGYCSDYNGFSIGFDYGKILNLSQEQGFILTKCVYDKRKQKKIIFKILNEAYNIFITAPNKQSIQPPLDRAISSFIHAFFEVAPFFKDSSFSEEAEWRLISLRNIQSFELKFRAGKSMIIPYTEFNLLAENHSELPIAEIIIGPMQHMDLSLISLKHLLNSSNIKSDIKSSKVPYRAR